jgi:hypothetical protein
MQVLVRVVGKKPREGRKSPTLYVNIPWRIAQRLDLKLNDYMIMDVDEKDCRITLRKIKLGEEM